MKARTLFQIAGISYLVIFLSAIFANFFVLDAIIQDPVTTIVESGILVRFGILAFLIAAVFDVFVAWALYDLYKNHVFSRVSTYFRILHAVIMGVAVFALVPMLHFSSSEAILAQVASFNTIWLIGLFFFGIHLIFLARIVKHIRVIPYIMMLAGVMYIVDTSAHILLPNYQDYANIFLALVAVPSILGEMAFMIWLLIKGWRKSEVVPAGG